ncbi:hypothetical protein ACDQ55_17260 [Chitinophaga sp. 30R24]|uniref:glycoside hydrolase family 130 protein n=1 Tax=Chitinophaga sp. 30R24 TaxID=3248838 RepID=UPI003B8ED8B1
MIRIKKEGILLKPTTQDFENEGVLNPATIRVNDEIFLYYRAVQHGNHSSIGFCKLSNPLTVGERLEKPLLLPENDYEAKGLEDPRVVRIDDVFHLTYTAYDGVTACAALATSTDGVTFEKKGLLGAQMHYDEFIRLASTQGPLNEKYARYNSINKMLWDKDVVFFPRRIQGKLYFLHRIKPDVQLVCVNDLSELTYDFWKEYYLHFQDHLFLTPRYPHEHSYVGAGCPPVETEYGWLLIYHGVHQTTEGYVYVGCAALMDLEDPRKEIARLPHPILVPERVWEVRGDVDNVCFPTGTVLEGDALYIYYGAGDEVIATGVVSLSELLNQLLAHKAK